MHLEPQGCATHCGLGPPPATLPQVLVKNAAEVPAPQPGWAQQLSTQGLCNRDTPTHTSPGLAQRFRVEHTEEKRFATDREEVITAGAAESSEPQPTASPQKLRAPNPESRAHEQILSLYRAEHCGCGQTDRSPI